MPKESTVETVGTALGSLLSRLAPNALLASGLAVMLPILPPHLPGIALGAAIGGLVAGARTKARPVEAAVLGGLTGLCVGLLALLFLGVVQLVRLSVPAASVSGTVFAQLDAGIGLMIALGIAAYAGVTGAGGAAFGGWLARRGGKSSSGPVG